MGDSNGGDGSGGNACDDDLVSGAKGGHGGFHGALGVAHAICMTGYCDECFRGNNDLLDEHRHCDGMHCGGYGFD